jgi:hypothetical protein
LLARCAAISPTASWCSPAAKPNHRFGRRLYSIFVLLKAGLYTIRPAHSENNAREGSLELQLAENLL